MDTRSINTRVLGCEFKISGMEIALQSDHMLFTLLIFVNESQVPAYLSSLPCNICVILFISIFAFLIELVSSQPLRFFPCQLERWVLNTSQKTSGFID